MRCPCCGNDNDRVVDSRATDDRSATRRRRECLICGARYTTYEHIERHMPRVIKRDGCRELFDRTKMERGLLSACQKRKIPSQAINQLIDDVIFELERSNAEEVPTELIGKLIMERLRTLDAVAYVRFASVYSAFDDVQQFMAAVNDIGLPPATTKPGRKRGRPPRNPL
ncbi:MAG: transcriptional repressor NrdR [Kiritimatiellae bacterium]|nr:transcriptional repressor NrdR [Kiritimatiellia bacterium]MBR4945914.1 transcriptional repressor NrdR [Kiritimatiellia bacterium]MBR5587361.1 transcriptional repressor NrdR [Kiritimatiellia bacterium]